MSIIRKLVYMIASKIECSLFWMRVLVCCLVCSTPSYSSWSDQCSSYRKQNISLTDLVQKSSYISLYRATKARPFSSHVFHDLKMEPTKYQMTLEATLKGVSPVTVEILGGKVEEGIPAYFFSTLQRHQEIDITSVADLGMALPKRLADSKKCRFVPNFKIGYSYLIFGGVDSQIGYELILDPVRDEWFKMVQKEVNSLQN